MRRYQRKAAGKVFLFVFAAMSNLQFQLSFNHLEWGEDIFTDKEKKYIEQLRNGIHKNAELSRRLGQRLCKSATQN